MTPTDAQAPGFETQIKPMFREHDRESMERSFDLWSYEDVSHHAHAILTRLKAGDMPCDGAWPQEKVDVFESWMEGGKPR